MENGMKVLKGDVIPPLNSCSIVYKKNSKDEIF